MGGAKIYRQLIKAASLARRAYAPYKAQIIVLTVLSFVGGLLEGIGINAVIPLLSLVLGIQVPATDAITMLIKDFFAFMHVPFVPRYLLAFIVILFIFKALIMFVFTYIQLRISTAYDRATRYRIFSSVFRTSWPYLLKQKLGNLETVIMVDTPQGVAMLNKLCFAISVIASLIMYLVVAYSISAAITTVTLLLGVLVFLILRPLLDKVHDISRERSVVYRDTMHHAGEHMGGIKTVKSYGVEEQSIASAAAHFDSIKTLSTRVGILQGLASQLIAPIGIIYIAAILALALKTPFISFAALPAMLYLIYRIMTYIQQLQNNIQYISEITPHLERVLEYEQSAREETEIRGGNEPFSLTRELSFKNVDFAYESGRQVLEGVSFSVSKGSMLGIVGPSGAGKTTCVDLMLRLLQPTSGVIELDGVDIQEIQLGEWRKRIAYVSQDFFLLQDTIRNNIRFYDESITDDDVWKAAEMAHIDDFIRECPEGLDTEVGDRGVRLSAGQRQRIVIARALARRPDVLILDEATSSLDAQAEAHIKRVIEELKGKVTIIAIAHRLSTIMNSDQLIVLLDGRIVEAGAPGQLLGNTDSYFYKVHNINQ